MEDLQCKGRLKQATSGSLKDIHHVPEITLPLPPPTPYLKRSYVDEKINQMNIINWHRNLSLSLLRSSLDGRFLVQRACETSYEQFPGAYPSCAQNYSASPSTNPLS